MSGPGPGKRANEVSMTRNIIGVVVLVVAVSVGIIEVMANQSYNAAVTKLNGEIEKLKKSPDDLGDTQPKIESIINKKPASSAKEGQENKVVYSWKGLFRTYSVTVYYTTTEDPPRLMRIGEES